MNYGSSCDDCDQDTDSEDAFPWVEAVLGLLVFQLWVPLEAAELRPGRANAALIPWTSDAVFTPVRSRPDR